MNAVKLTLPPLGRQQLATSKISQVQVNLQQTVYIRGSVAIIKKMSGDQGEDRPRNIVKFTSLEIGSQDLLRQAVNARGFAYCPYSKFQVGAALQCKNGSIFTGCNVENSAYGMSICAERTAFVKAISTGITTFKSIAIIADLESKPSYYVSPCGACRQFMAEFGTDIVVYLAKPELGNVQITSVEELLPFSFKF